MIQRLSALLEDAGVELSTDELRDALWLAATTAPSGGTADGDEAAGATGPLAPLAPAEDAEEHDKAARTGPAADVPVREPEPEPAAPAGLFAPGARPAAARPARAVGVRGVPALPAARGLSRALRPLRRTVPSRTSFRLDEDATADWIAETGLPDAMLRARRERWLSAVLVVDDGPSMVLWQQLAAEVRGMLERQGAFRAVRTYGLDSAVGAEPRLRARPYAPEASRRTARQLTDTSGRTMILVLSDGVGPGWRSGAIPRLLRRWARHSPVAVVQPLPPRMWPERGMPTQRLLVGARGRAGAPGRALTVRHPVLPPGLVAYTGTPVPVLPLAEAELGAWAALTGTGEGSALLPVMLLEGGDKPVAAPATAEVPEPTPEERLRRFGGGASPEGRRLAGALATVHPLTLPVMRLIHQASGTGSAQLAEVFLGGLLRRREGRADEYEFYPGVADLLLDGVRTSDALDTAKRVTEFLLRRRGSGPEFRARLSGERGDAGVAPEARPFAAASPELLRRLGLLGEEPYERPEPEEPPSAPEPPVRDFTARSYVSERVQPPFLALVRRIAADKRIAALMRVHLDRLLGEAEERDEKSGWVGVGRLPGLAEALTEGGWRDYADELRGTILEQLPVVSSGEELESRNLRGHLALALNKLGEREEAERQLRAVVETSALVHGRDHQYTLNARVHLAALLEDAGNLMGAEWERHALIDAYLRSPEDRRAEVAGLRVKRGRLLLRLVRREEAEREFRVARRELGDLEGWAHPDTVDARVWLSHALAQLGRYDEAESESRAAVADCGPSDEGDLLAWATAVFRLAQLLGERGREEEAEELWREAAERLGRGHGPEHQGTLSAAFWHITALRGLDRYEEAQTEVSTLIDASDQARGEQHVGSFEARRLRAMILGDQKRYEEAEAAFRGLLAMQTDVLGREHPSTLATAHGLGVCLAEAGRYEEALTEFTEVLRNRIATLGAETESTLVTRYCRASALADLGRREEAEAEYRVTMAAEARVRGPDDPGTLLTHRMLADLLRTQERYGEAEVEYRHVVDGRARVLGPEAEATLAVRHSLGNVLNKLGRFAEAEAEIRATAALRARVLGAEDSATLWTRYNLGTALKGLGRLDEAEAEWRAVLDISERVLGDEHRCTRKTREALAGLRAADGDDDDQTP
ncbi:SAV_2336 N-terminal domain-related protein [Streptomyces sp. NPDC021212]|uniref:SAV_2336 N-terminal domain-related protein n=1 Tax=Streptomyces sp. NPDC021212 TaxID=3365118 RepID=UPI0037890B69